MTKPLISVKDLTLRFRTDEGLITAVEDVSFDIAPGEILGLVGESGSGKSVTAKSLMLLNPDNAVYDPKSSITLNIDDEQIDVFALANAKDRMVIRGGSISMIFQEPMASFAPAISVGAQMVEQLLIHSDMNAATRSYPSRCWHVLAFRIRSSASASMRSSSPAVCANGR
jgi:ABC-type dipeptide/oligopeptide/nickel transport system ATPase component